MTAPVIFAEGAHAPDARGFGSEFEQLWRLIATPCGVPQPQRVVGFHKGNIVSMDPKLMRYEPLDQLIHREHSKAPFSAMVLAFDTEPRHDGLPRNCRHDEVALLLDGFAKSQLLPPSLKAAAVLLLQHYSASPDPTSRGAGRPPRHAVEVLAMEPMFEGLLLADEKGLRQALGVSGKRIRNWPSFRLRTARPDRDILAKATALAADAVQRQVGSRPFLENKHGWARWILTRLPNTSPTWQHPIASRLSLLMT